jgi:hypothetical protein
MCKKSAGNKPDLLFHKNNMEFGCGEFALEDEGEDSTKELREKLLKCPGMMKAMFDLLVQGREDVKDG